jgi:hypothetical protein
VSEPTLTETVQTNAALPKSTTIDGLSVEMHDLATVDEVAARQKATAAAKKSHRGLRFNKLVPPGAS